MLPSHLGAEGTEKYETLEPESFDSFIRAGCL